jgi:DNA-binding transcriptional ArsR family regulator
VAARRPPRDARRELDEIDAVFSGLAHPSRRQVLLVLWHRGGRMTAGEIADRFDCAWPTTTRHLQKLEAAGLVAVEAQGRERVYRLEHARLRAVVAGWIGHFTRPRARRARRA